MENFVFTVEKVKSEEVPHTYLIIAEGPNHFRSLLKSVKGQILHVSSLDKSMDLISPNKEKGRKNIYQVVFSNPKSNGVLLLANNIEEVIDRVLDLADQYDCADRLESIELYSEGVEVLM